MINLIFITLFTLLNSFNMNYKTATFGSGCFWCTEAIFEIVEGIKSVESGYSGGNYSNPTYKLVTSGITNHAEVIQIKYDPNIITYIELLEIFWKTHDPTTINRQGNDVGTQYRSACYCKDSEELTVIKSSLEKYQGALSKSNLGQITTELKMNQKYFLAEEYHQQYLDKNPNGYCGIGGTGCEFKI